MLASVSGFQMLRFGQFWLIFELTGSPLSLGWIGLANGIPAIVLNLFGGVAADRIDQRRMVMISQSIIALLIFFLATITVMGVVNQWHLIAIAFLAGAVEAFDQPARRVLFPQLVDRKDLMSAVAMNAAIWPGTRILAPAIAGIIIAVASTATCFYIAGIGFLVMAVVTSRLPIPNVARTSRSRPFHDILEGLSFISKDTKFAFLIAMTFFSSFFGMAYIPLMPMITVDVLGVGSKEQGLILGAGGVGSLITALWFGAKSNSGSKGMLIIGGAIMSGLMVATFAITAGIFKSVPLAMALMTILSVFNTLSNTASQSSLQLLVPDPIRGRVMGFYGMTYNIRPLGGMQASALASISAIGAPIAIAIGGLAVASFPIIAMIANRKVRNLSSELRQAEAEVIAASRTRQPSSPMASS
jgi:MFS family permease